MFFTSDFIYGQLFSGNPAAVIFSEAGLPPETMQSIAAENNLPETAFVVTGGESHPIRWFTPTVEVDLCGHATLAAAHVLFNHLGWSGGEGLLFLEERPLVCPEGGGAPVLGFSGRFDTARGTAATPDPRAGRQADGNLQRQGRRYIAVLDSEDIDPVRSVPDMALLSEAPARGVIVTAPGREVDFVPRFFAPRSGIPEDPVTGSAHPERLPLTGRGDWQSRIFKPDKYPSGAEGWCALTLARRVAKWAVEPSPISWAKYQCEKGWGIFLLTCQATIRIIHV